MNVMSFTGHIGRDAETRYTTGGDAIASFSVALTHGYGEKKGTAWMRCALFGKRAESLAPYLVKGQLVGIVGEFAPREYEKDGQTRTSMDVRVNDVTLLGKSERQEQRQEPVRQEQREPLPDDGFADSIPF